MVEFDTLVVGSGPAALAALIGLDDPGRLCVVTGAAPGAGVDASDVHAKIRAVAGEQREVPGVTEPISIAGASHRVFSTAITGGLANYWGQQFVRYAAAEPWPRAIFDRYDDYQAACSRLEAEFQFDETNGPSSPNASRIGAYRANSPKLLVGTRQEPTAGLLSIRRRIERKVVEQRATTIEARVESLELNGALWQAKLSNGFTILAGRIILAAGVLGTASLMMRSFPDIRSVRLRDHAPLMLHTHGLERLINTQRRGPDPHFNVQNLQRDTQEGAALFATVYNMRYVELNLILLMLLGKFIPHLAGYRAPWPANWIKPVQVWTGAMTTTVEIDRDRGAARVVDRPVIGRDQELAMFTQTLRDNGVTIMKTTETPPLQGFHYFGLEISADGAGYVPVERYLAQRSIRQVLCVDASVLPEIGCRPHTETAMASAMKLASGIDQPAAMIGTRQVPFWQHRQPLHSTSDAYSD